MHTLSISVKILTESSDFPSILVISSTMKYEYQKRTALFSKFIKDNFKIMAEITFTYKWLRKRDAAIWHRMQVFCGTYIFVFRSKQLDWSMTWQNQFVLDATPGGHFWHGSASMHTKVFYVCMPKSFLSFKKQLSLCSNLLWTIFEFSF